MSDSRLGLQIGATTRPSELGALAAEAEQLGYSEIWLAEDYFELGGIASAVAALAATHRIPVGLGVVAAGVRHPAVTAMEFATVGGIYPGRFKAGIGHGAPHWVREMGLTPESPMGLLREAADAVGRLLAGETVSGQGRYFSFDDTRLSHLPEVSVPLYFGVHGPQSLRLSGELADGTLLGWFSSPRYVAWARQQIDEGRERADRRDPHNLTVLCVVSLSNHHPERARAEVSRWARPLLSAMAESPQIRVSGLGMSELVGGEETEFLPDDVIDAFMAAGDVESCAAMIDRLLEAGADQVVLVPNPAGFRTTGEMADQIRAAAVLAA